MKMENANEIRTPIKAIRAKCLDCCCDQREEVKLCPAKTCPLWRFRMGKNPNRSVNLTDEQRAAIKERLAKARKSKKNP